MQLAAYGRRLEPSDSPATRNFTTVVEALSLYTSATGLAPLSLGGWEAEDETIGPPPSLVTALEAIPARLHGYTYMRELHRAKSQAAQVFQDSLQIAGERLTERHVAVIENSTQALLLTFAALRDEGIEQVVVATPGYFAAVEVCRRLGFQVSCVPAASFLTGALDIPAIAAALKGRRAALLVTNPAYSVGVEYGWPSLRALFAAIPADCPVVLDETRLGLNWRDEAPWYVAEYPEQAIVIRSPSKIFFVSGMKTSLVLATPQRVRCIEYASESLVGSAPGALEETALAYLACWWAWMTEAQSSRVGPLRAWRRSVIARLRGNLRPSRAALEEQGFLLSPVDSGPYTLAAIPREGARAFDCAALARERGVLMMDSSYFYHESPSWLGFRLNLCVRAERLGEAIERAVCPTVFGP